MPDLHYPAELLTAYNRLIEKKLRGVMSPDEEAELADVRIQINAFDGQGSASGIREQAALVVEEELSRLRREIEALPPLKDHDSKKAV